MRRAPQCGMRNFDVKEIRRHRGYPYPPLPETDWVLSLITHMATFGLLEVNQTLLDVPTIDLLLQV